MNQTVTKISDITLSKSLYIHGVGVQLRPEFDAILDQAGQFHFVWIGAPEASMVGGKALTEGDLTELYYSSSTADLKSFTVPCKIASLPRKKYEYVFGERRPKLFNGADGMHVLVVAPRQILHYSSDDGGKTWQERAAIASFPVDKDANWKISPLVDAFLYGHELHVVYRIIRDYKEARIMVAHVHGSEPPRSKILLAVDENVFAHGCAEREGKIHVVYKSQPWQSTSLTINLRDLHYFCFDEGENSASMPLLLDWQLPDTAPEHLWYPRKDDPVPLAFKGSKLHVFNGEVELEFEPEHPANVKVHPHRLGNPIGTTVFQDDSRLFLPSEAPAVCSLSQKTDGAEQSWRLVWCDARLGISVPDDLPTTDSCGASLFDCLILPMLPFGDKIYGAFHRSRINPEILTGTCAQDEPIVQGIVRLSPPGYYCANPVICAQGKDMIVLWRAHKLNSIQKYAPWKGAGAPELFAARLSSESLK